MTRVVFLSDLHLSPTHGFFYDNWLRARDATDATGIGHVVVTGDLCINGPDSDAEMAFAADAVSRLHGRVLALPGNHDVGDEPPGQDARQLVDRPRLERWNRAFGTDRFVLDIGHWRLIGLNAQLLGAGLADELEQWDWLEVALTGATGRPIALILHKPIFLESAREATASPACITPAPRAWLLRLIEGKGVRLIVSGHLHQARDRAVDGIRHLWLPATSFVHPAHALGGEPRLGAAILDFSTDEVDVTELPVPGLVTHDLAALKGHGQYAFLRDMPPCPPQVKTMARMA
jgi:3',5'-cyclic AMP phosphodiesterase CpdA